MCKVVHLSPQNECATGCIQFHHDYTLGVFSNSRDDICAGPLAAQRVLMPVESGIYKTDSCLEIMYYGPDQILDAL